MDISVTNKAGIAPGTDGYFNIFPVNGSTYAFTRNTNACNSLGIQMLKTSGSLCNSGNIPSLPTYVSAICGDGVNVYYFTDLQSSNKMQLYKRAASGTLSILAEIPYAMGNQPLISDMAYAAGKVYWTLKDPRTKLQSISTSPGSVVQTMLSLAPERYYGKIVICNGLICLVGSDRMAYPHLQIINLQDQKLWELPASDNRKMALIDNTDIYAILSNPQNSHMQEIGIYTAFGQYEKLYDVTGADISGATSIHMFKTSKGIVILVEGNQLPSLWNSITGERLQGRIFLLQGKKLIHLRGNNYLPPTQVDAFNAKYDTENNNWKVNFTAPSEPGEYLLQIVLYCSNNEAYCGHKYSRVEQYEKILKLRVVSDLSKYQFTRWLSVGLSGADVKDLQRRLFSYGYYQGPITGYFGPLTRSGVIKLQQDVGFNTTGAVGPATLSALNSK